MGGNETLGFGQIEDVNKSVISLYMIQNMAGEGVCVGVVRARAHVRVYVRVCVYVILYPPA